MLYPFSLSIVAIPPGIFYSTAFLAFSKILVRIYICLFIKLVILAYTSDIIF